MTLEQAGWEFSCARDCLAREGLSLSKFWEVVWGHSRRKATTHALDGDDVYWLFLCMLGEETFGWEGVQLCLGLIPL